MVSNIVCLSGVLVILALIDPAFSVDCFECQAEIGQNISCETDVWASRSNQTCSLGFVCSKYIIRLGNTTTLYRKCSFPDVCTVLKAAAENPIDGEIGQSVSINQTIISCFTCNDTLCNSVTLASLNLGLFGAALLGLVGLVL